MGENDLGATGGQTVNNAVVNDIKGVDLPVSYGSKPIVGYLSAWGADSLNDRATADFIFSYITDLAYISAVGVNPDASLNISYANTFSNVVASTHAHGRKVVICIGDGDGSTDNNGNLVNFAPLRPRVARWSPIFWNFARNTTLTGWIFDWEFPPASSQPDFILLLNELRAASPPGFLISAAVMYGSPTLASAPVDWFYIMAYTFNLQQCTDEVNTWLSSGAPGSKLVLGMGLFGQSSSGGQIGYGQLIGTNNIDPSLDSYNGITFTGINTVVVV